jgi:imidazolonepropionase-like amidohydrolase
VFSSVRPGLAIAPAVSPQEINAWEFALMTGLGMSPVDVFKSTASVNAESLGIAAEVGTLESGRIADIIARHGDPTTDITDTVRIVFVMKEGLTPEHRRHETGVTPSRGPCP